MKTTKLMALGLVGLTTLGLAATANAAESSPVQTQASVSFTMGNESGNQDGPEGEVSGENPIDETPEAVHGWKLAVPSVLTFVGEGPTLVEKDGVSQTVYNRDNDNNNYVSQGINYADGVTPASPFFLRFEIDGEASLQDTFSVTVARDQFKVNYSVLDTDVGSSITFPEFKKYPDAVKSAVIGNLDSQEVTLAQPGVSKPVITSIDLKRGAEAQNQNVGFVDVGETNAVKLHLLSQSKTLSSLSRATVTTTLTWTFVAGVTNN